MESAIQFRVAKIDILGNVTYMYSGFSRFSNGDADYLLLEDGSFEATSYDNHGISVVGTLCANQGLLLRNNRIRGVADPEHESDAVDRRYIDALEARIAALEAAAAT